MAQQHGERYIVQREATEHFYPGRGDTFGGSNTIRIYKLANRGSHSSCRGWEFWNWFLALISRKGESNMRHWYRQDHSKYTAHLLTWKKRVPRIVLGQRPARWWTLLDQTCIRLLWVVFFTMTWPWSLPLTCLVQFTKNPAESVKENLPLLVPDYPQCLIKFLISTPGYLIIWPAFSMNPVELV